MLSLRTVTYPLAVMMLDAPSSADTVATYLDVSGAESAILEVADDGSARMGSPGDQQPFRILQNGAVYHIWPSPEGPTVMRAEDLDAALSSRVAQPPVGSRGPRIELKPIEQASIGRFQGVAYVMTINDSPGPSTWVLSPDPTLSRIGRADRQFRIQGNSTMMITQGLPAADMSAVYRALETAAVVKDHDTMLSTVVDRADQPARFSLPTAPLTRLEVLARYGAK